MLPFKEKTYHKIPSQNKDKEIVLVGDIGGTNSNFGLCLIDYDQKTVVLLYSLHIKSGDIHDFTETVCDVLTYVQHAFGLTITKACFGIAGVMNEEQKVRPTNLPFIVDLHHIKQKTALTYAVMINDFVALGYGLEAINKTSIQQIAAGKNIQYANKSIIGAGTGFGKTMLVWSVEKNYYIPLPSEGGHADFPVQYEQDFALVEFIRNKYKWPGSISWEDILSGQGIMLIYEFLGTIKKYKSTKNYDNLHPDQIFSLRHIDARCDNAIELFVQFYARCAKDFALNTLSRNGLYIAGGIAAHNPDIFQMPLFMKEFLNNRKQKELLETISLYVITDYAISLYGGAVYILLNP